jgi:hypothetical protein
LVVIYVQVKIKLNHYYFKYGISPIVEPTLWQYGTSCIWLTRDVAVPWRNLWRA